MAHDLLRDARPLLWAMGLAAAISGCVLDPVPVENLRCPCATPLVCDEDTQTCIDTGVCGRVGAEPSELRVVRFERWWVTATQARLRWEMSAPDRVSSFAIDVADSADALASGAFETIDGSTNPELARGFLPLTSGRDAVESTILRALVPDRPHVARLVVYDDAGHVSCSGAVPFQTNVEPGRFVLFEESLPTDARLRVKCSQIAEDAANAGSGTAFLAHTFRCEQRDGGTASVCNDPVSVAPHCWENVGFSGASLGLMQPLTDGPFSTAYVEVSVAVDDETSAFWGEFAVTSGEGDYYQVDEITIVADGAYHTYEIPLAQLTRYCDEGQTDCVSGTPFQPAALTMLTGFRVGMGLNDGARMRLDDIRLRW